MGIKRENIFKLYKVILSFVLLFVMFIFIDSAKAQNFNYTGSVQEFTAPSAGLYKLEVWGAQGGSATANKTTKNGGYGGYSVGYIELQRNQKVYVYVGGKGADNISNNNASGGYNGGGSITTHGGTSFYGGSGGGATHIALENRGELSSYEDYKNDILIVSGGGGGAGIHFTMTTSLSNSYAAGGSGGGFEGVDGEHYINTQVDKPGGKGGTQTNGGDGYTAGSFGVGGGFHTGGGGGYYGGGGTGYGDYLRSAAGGGSGYIGNQLLYSYDNSPKQMTCYSCNTSDIGETRTVSTNCHNSTATSDCSKEGNGYARIEFITSSADLDTGDVFRSKITSNITSIRHATSAQYDLVKDNLTSDNIVSTSTSPYEVYVWQDGSTLYYYSEAVIIYMNPDSARMFGYDVATNLTYIDLSGFDTSHVTSMSYMFSGSRSLESLDLSGFDTSHVTDMSYMFFGTGVQELDVSNFDTSNVTDMKSMFKQASLLETIEFGNFNTDKVTDIQSMFNGCTKLQELDLSSFNTNLVTNTSSMFYNCQELRELDLSNFDTSHFSDVRSMFSNVFKLTTIYVGDQWSIPSNASSANMFKNSTRLMGYIGTSYDGDHIDKGYAVVDTQETPGYLTSVSNKGETHIVTFPDGEVELLPHNSILYMETNTSSNVVPYNITLKYHDGSTSDGIFVNNISYSGNGYLVDTVHSDEPCEIRINQNRTIEYDYFDSGTGSTLPTPTRNGYIFDGWYTEETGGELVERPDSESITVLHARWAEDAAYLKEGQTVNNKMDRQASGVLRKATLAEYNTATLTDDNIISTDDSLYPVYLWSDGTDILYYTDAEKIYLNANSSRLFSNIDVTSIDFSDFDTSNVTNMSYMFYALEFMEELDLSSLNTSNVTNMSYMFHYDRALRELDLSSFDTSNVTNMSYMFNECYSIEELDLSSFDTSSLQNTSQMFRNSRNLRTVYVSDTWDLSNVTNDAGMFWNDNLIGYYGWQFYWNTGDEWNRFYNKTYARIDTEDPDNRGYFTDASHKGETHTITYSDGVVEVYPHNYRITIRSNELTKSPEKVAEVTLKYHNGVTSDTKLDVLQLYYPSGWYNSVDDQSYHYSTFRITKNLELEAVFEAGNYVTDGDLPRPEKEGYTFIGWYTEEEGGEQVTEYHEAEDIVLHAHWTDPFAELLPGYELSYMISEIAAASDDFNENAKYFRKGTEEEYNLVKDELTEDNLISDKDYGEYVYAWRTEEEILYYSKAEDIFMNEDSSNAFAYQSLVTIDLSGLNPSNVIDMTHMFGRNFDLVSVNFGDNFNTGNVVNMSEMFAACPSLESVDLSSLNTQNVELMYSMFSSDESLETVTFGNIDTRNLQDMGNMFSYCTSLTSVDMSNLDLRSLEYTDNMFDGCTSLTDLQLSRKPILNVTSTYGMFNNCSSLEELDLTTFSTRNLSSIENMFTYMSNLQTIYVSDLWDASNFEESNDVFCEDTNLVGEKGTTYDPDHVGEDYAIVDDAPDHPGYLTYRQINPFIIYPDGSSIQVEYGSTFTLPSKWDKEDEVVGTAVLDHQDGISDYEYLDVVRHYYLSSWYIDDTEYYPEDNIVVLSDIYLEPDYYYYTEGVNLGTPKWDMHTFDGWYTESEGGNRVYYYNDEGDAYFYAHWTERSQARIFKPDNTYEDVDLGTEYDLGTNGYSDYLIIGGVLFDYNIPDGQDSPYQYVYNVITPNGWLVNDTHYDDDTVLTVNGDLYIDYDSNSEIIPVEIPSEAHWEDWEFLGWKNRDTGEYYTDSTYSEGDSITLIGQWDKHEVKLTIDGEVQYVHEGYEYEVPSVHMFNDSIMFYLDFNDYNNPRYEEVTLAYGIDVNYQNINGVRYDIGDTYIVNEDTVINTISDTGKRVIMTPEIEDPEQRLDDQGNPEIFKGWFLNNVDYTDLIYVNVDIHALTPEDTDMNYQSLFAEYESYDPETQAIINYKDEYRMINYTKVVDKGYEFTLEDISEENIIDFQIVDSVDQTRNRGQIVVSAIVDHYDINGNNYDPDGSTYTVNENVNIEVVRVVSKARTCGGYYCSLIDEPIPSRVSNVSNTEEYIYNGIFTDDNGEGDQIDFDNYGNSSSNINYGQNIWGYFYFLREPNIILTVDNEVSIIQKGIGTIPDARNKGIDHIANVTFDFNDGETDPIVADAHYEYIFNHFEVEGVGAYQPGVEYDYEEDTTITSVYDQITWFPKFPRMDDETFIGWFTEREGGEEVLYFETLDSDITLYAHYEDPYSKVFESVIYAVADKEKEDQSVDRIIIGAESGTTVSDFKGNMDNPEEFIKIYDQDDNLLSDDDVVATGSIIKLDINGTVFDEAIIIVRGDINGDGIVNLMDRAVLADHLLSITDIEGFYLYAADINSDNVVNLQDRAILADYLLGIIDTLNE